MSKLISEDAPSVESGASGNSKVVASERTKAGGLKTQSSLPSPAGARTVKPSTSKHVERSNSGGSKPRDIKPKQPKFSKTSKISIDKSVHQFRMTEVYKKAIGATFRDKAALDRFNNWVKKNKSQIEPGAFSLCENCGHIPEDLEVCDCYIRPAKENTDVESDSLFVPMKESAVVWRSTWLDGVKQWFIRPKLNLTSFENPHVGGFSNELITSDVLIQDLYTYLLLRRKADYVVDGIDDRRARVNHFTTLAQSWLLEHKQKFVGQQLELPRRVAFTIQRAADDPVHDILLTRTDPVKNKFWQYFSLARMAAKMSCNKRLIIMLTPVLITMLPARLRLKIYSALLKPILSYLRRHLQASGELLLTGSALALRQIIILLINFARLVISGISSGVVSQLPSTTQLPFMETAATTSSIHCTSAISKILRPLKTLIGHSFSEFANHWLDASSKDTLADLQLRIAMTTLVG